MLKKLALFSMILVFIMFSIAGCSKSDTSPSNQPAGNFIPKLTTWSSYDVGSSTYMQASFLGEGISEKYGTKVRIIPVGSPVSRHLALRTRDADMTFTGLDAWLMQEGLFEYSEKSWGPQAVQIIWFAQTGGFPHAVRADSSIQTAADLKGKRLPYFPGSASLNLYTDGILAYAGLTRNDVVSVNVPSYVGAQDMVMDGKLDAALIATEAPKAYEWAAMPYGIRYLTVPHSDTAGWDRLKAVFPEYGKYVAKFGAGVDKDKPIEVGIVSSPRLTVYDWMDENYAYFLTKAVYETYSLFAPKNDTMKLFWTMENNFILFEGSAMPFHAGAVKFYKEIGVWTDKYEQMNQARLKHQKNIQELWKKVVDQATKEGIKDADFSAYWMKKRKEAGF